MEDPAKEDQKYLVVPTDSLAPETLEALIDEFLLREGTDYGSVELTLEAKRSRALRQLQAGHVRVVFDLENESATLIEAKELGNI